MFRVLRPALAAAFLVAMSAAVEACAVPRPLPTKTTAASAHEPKLGFVGKVLATFESEEGNASGRAIVQIEITQDFSGKLPPMIYALNPGCCVCVGISGARGEEVVSIVRRGDDGLFYPDY